MATKNKTVKLKYRLCMFVPLCLVLIITVFISVGSYWVQIADKYQEKNRLEEEIVVLKEKEEELKVDANKLQNPDYIARYAREKYLYSKDGEFILKIPEE